MNQSLPRQQGLYHPTMEHDACGVGFLAHMKGEKSHKIIQDAIKILENLEHRGATGSDPKTGDGAGILIQMPDAFLREECGKLKFELPPEGVYGAGMVFLPTHVDERNQCEEWFEEIIHEEGQHFLGWRDVPHDSSEIGHVAHSVEPEFRQVFIGRGHNTVDAEGFERKLYIIRKRLELLVRNSDLKQKNYFYIPSLSSKTIVYKGQLMSSQLNNFYPDLTHPAMVSCVAIVHSRYSTNTFPTWSLAHPYRILAHNGEINTLRGNINWMNAREKQFISEKFGEDIKKILPIITPNMSDSASLDNALEMLVMAGRSLPHAVMMLIPEAWTGHESMEAEKRVFYEYHSCLMEPWDGPASVAFTDGRYVGAVLDRNGLRPSRYLITKDNLVIMASETGVLDIPPENVFLKGRLEPGKMFLVDTVEGRIIDDKELKQRYASRRPYGKWAADNVQNIERLPAPAHFYGLDQKTLQERQLVFGYTLEDIKVVLQPMAVEGEEAIGSMGNDTPLAVLSKKPQLLFNYFKQLFAQVTNPPIDSIREELVMSTEVMLGSEQNLLDETPRHARRLKLHHPILTNKDLAKIAELDQDGLRAATLPTLFTAHKGPGALEGAMEELFHKADQAIADGCNILALSDRGVDKDNAPIPSLLAISGLHHHLIRQGTRTRVSLVLESGEPREMHHFALLIGYGANAINPYLVFETILEEVAKGVFPPKLTLETSEKILLKATRKGLLKIIAKMGISTIQSYCGAQIFEAIGLGEELVKKYFTATISRVGGITIKTVAEEALARHAAAFPKKDLESAGLPSGGAYQWRKDGEFHQHNPETVAMLQQAVRAGDYSLYKKYAQAVNDQSKNLATLRGLLKFKKGRSIPLSEVEPAREIVKRFATGAMSYGSISRETHETLAIAMNRLGGFSNTGEGGEDPQRFKPDPNGDLRRSRIKQVASGRFGVTIEYLVNSDQIQIKMAQGAKPGEGGQLPGHKVNQEIAKTRHTTPGVGLISPPPHHDIYSIEDLAQLIYDLKNANPRADISVKLVAEIGVGTVAAGVAKGKAEHVLISGHDGGTGASPQTSIKYAGLPWELGLAETQQTLVLNDLRGRIRVQTDGQFKTGRDVVVASLLGADEFGFSTLALIACGCVLLRKCHLNTCSVGVATQDPELRKFFAGTPANVVNLFTFIAEETRELMAELGFRTLSEMTGRVDRLETQEAVHHWKAKGLDLANILHKPDVAKNVPIRHVMKQEHDLTRVLDQSLIQQCQGAIETKKPVKIDNIAIRNVNRTVATMLSSEIARRWGFEGLPDNTIQLSFKGSAGQSFGAFLSRGVALTLEGDSNDYLGKGLSGGRIVVYPPKEATFIPEKNVIVGNTLLYGAILGEVYIRGIAGERFAVRNSGANAVIEGMGDHGCEYMTGGRVVVLGPAGRNFAAGMSGGIAYVWDREGDFAKRCNLTMVDLVPLAESTDIQEVKTLIENHVRYTGSTVGDYVLKNWDLSVKQFIKVYPQDYRRVIEEAQKLAASQGPQEAKTHG